MEKCNLINEHALNREPVPFRVELLMHWNIEYFDET